MKRATFAITFILGSMGLVAAAVKTQDEISKLVQTLMASGGDGKYVNGHAQAVGLDGPMPLKGAMAPIGKDRRRCQVVYEADEINGDRPFCVYLLRTTDKTQHDGEERYYRVSLDGRLEKVVILRRKLNDKGEALREGRSRFEEDITSPEIKKAFQAEMTFWLKDWLKKQRKGPKKAASAPSYFPRSGDS